MGERFRGKNCLERWQLGVLVECMRRIRGWDEGACQWWGRWSGRELVQFGEWEATPAVARRQEETKLGGRLW